MRLILAVLPASVLGMLGRAWPTLASVIKDCPSCPFCP